MSDLIDTLVSDVTGAAGTYTANSVRITLKTNLGPEVTVYDPTDASPSLLSQLGVQAALNVYDTNGNLLTTVGTVPATNPLMVIAALAVLAGIGIIVLKGMRNL